MYLVVIAWMYVVLMMAIVEALSPQGSVLGAIITFVIYGLLPLSIAVYILGTPARRAARRRAEAEESATAADLPTPSAVEPDAGRHAARHALAPEREEP